MDAAWKQDDSWGTLVWLVMVVAVIGVDPAVDRVGHVADAVERALRDGPVPHGA
jgi:hypothetical protein